MDLCSFGFDDLPMGEDETILASVRMFTDCGFLDKFMIDQKVCRALKGFLNTNFISEKNFANVSTRCSSLQGESGFSSLVAACMGVYG